jgi:ribosomal protection tetracycline resistance protein
MKSLNIGILAHVDAGKTSLTERLLFNSGVISTLGSVDQGNTQTDSMALERQRGITIKSAVASFVVDDITINLLDTPGHPDFIAEVERVLSVLDGVILVISAVEGVQAQTRVLMRALQRLKVPTTIFVNKIDRSGARYESLLESIAEKLTPSIVSMGSVRNLGTHSPSFVPYTKDDGEFTNTLTDLLANHNDSFMSAYIDDKVSVSYPQLRQELAVQTKKALVHPIFFGSAITGTGVDVLTAGVKELLPQVEGNMNGAISGTVFKVERSESGEKIAYVRIFSGTVKTREPLQFGQNNEGKVTAINIFENGSTIQSNSVAAGQIGKLWGLADIQIGDAIGVPHKNQASYHFAPPTLETVIVPRNEADKGALRVALDQLAEQDPLINVRQDDIRQELSVSLYGEVQKEVIQDTLANDFGIDVEFRETTTICVERPLGVGQAMEEKTKVGSSAAEFDGVSNPFLATIGLKVEPAPLNSGVTFRFASEVSGTMPHAFFRAVEETVKETLHQGVYGWQVTDCIVTMTHSGYWPRQSSAHGGFDKNISSTARDFRYLTPLVLMDALKDAGVAVCEPVHHFELEVPMDTLSTLLPVLAQLGATPQTTKTQKSSYVLSGDIPAAQVHNLQQQLPGLTSGEGVLECTFDRYEPVRGEVPTRPRSDQNPVDRKEYLLRVLKRT